MLWTSVHTDSHHSLDSHICCSRKTLSSSTAAPARTREQLAGAQVRVQRPDDAEGDAHAQQQRAPQVVLAARVAVQQLLPLLRALAAGASPHGHVLHTRCATSRRHRSGDLVEPRRVYTAMIGAVSEYTGDLSATGCRSTHRLQLLNLALQWRLLLLLLIRRQLTLQLLHLCLQVTMERRLMSACNS